MFLPRDMLLLCKCELNHHVDLITVYDGLGHGFNSIHYLNSLPVKTNILHTSLVNCVKNNPKLASVLCYFWMHCCIAPSHFVWLAASRLSINAGLNTPFREKGNLTFKDVFTFTPSWLGPKCFPEKQTFHIYSEKKSPRVIIQKNHVDPQKQQCVIAAALWLRCHSFGRGQNLNAEGKLRWCSAWLHCTPHCTFMTFPMWKCLDSLRCSHVMSCC